jgi:hypothetical protein
MSYRKFTYTDLQEKLALDLQQANNLFADAKPIAASGWLIAALERTKNYPKTSEKARSEMLVFPILTDLIENNKDFCTIYSGENLDADKKRGLNGECDYIISTKSISIAISTPIFTIIEAKRAQSIEQGIPQCVAQMVGASIYNQKNKAPATPIFGCVTFGEVWKFMKLDGHTVFIDSETYYLNDVPKILGVLQMILDFYKK